MCSVHYMNCEQTGDIHSYSDNYFELHSVPRPLLINYKLSVYTADCAGYGVERQLGRWVSVELG